MAGTYYVKTMIISCKYVTDQNAKSSGILAEDSGAKSHCVSNIFKGESMKNYWG